MNPPKVVVDVAAAIACLSPCAKSKRGAVVWRIADGLVMSGGCNAPAPPLSCNGSEACRQVCSQICEHAEIEALRNFQVHRHEQGFDLLHVKVVDGELVSSGGPSCWQCSRSIARDGRIDGVWLYHADGWRRYGREEFHRLTLDACGLSNDGNPLAVPND